MNIIGKTKIWFTISLITLLIGIASIGFFRLKLAIDFTGGSLLQLKVPSGVNQEEIRSILLENGFEQVTVTQAGQGSIVIRSKPVDQVKKTTAIKKIQERVGGKGKVKEEQFETIGPTVSNDLINKAIESVLLASLGIIGYVAFAFRKLSANHLSWRFGITAIIALIHDLLFTVGIFALTAKYLSWEVDSLFITALLTVMGFSVHDTIVVFDRIRENLRRHPGDEFSQIVNMSIVQTLARSLNTSLTILITLAALLLLGGKTLQPFVFTLFIGIFVGTYSSIFVASPFVVVWQRFIDTRANKNR